MPKMRKTRVTRIKFKVNVTQQHIDDGACRLASKCMEKLAVQDALRHEYPRQQDPFSVRIDGAHCSFNAEGYRWKADTHRVAKKALIDFDHKKSVAPHSYTLEAERKNKIIRNSRDRTKQINDARKRRAAEGRPDKKYTLHRRVVGLA